jgi:Zn-finger nucleic acid-binding protein
MQACASCQAAIDTHGVFPGASVCCPACGHANVVEGPAAAPAPHHDLVHAPPHAPVHEAPLPPLCPRCPRPLENDGDTGGMRCAKCRGTFMPLAALGTAVDAARPDPSPHGHAQHAARVPREPDVRYVHCPECRQVMARMNFGQHSGIVVDTCKNHGTWLDGGELEAALEFVHAGGLEPGPAPAGEPPMDMETAQLTRNLQAELNAEMRHDIERVRQVALEAQDVLFLLSGQGYMRRPWRGSRYR